MIDRHETVYHSKVGAPLPEDWNETRKKIIKRDGQCYRCETRQRRHLTVHHIVPRIEGGSDDPSNLITLCTQCHDIVETAQCRSLLDIENTIEKDEPAPVSKKERPSIPDREETFIRPEWHKWVYGGQRRPT